MLLIKRKMDIGLWSVVGQSSTEHQEAEKDMIKYRSGIKEEAENCSARQRRTGRLGESDVSSKIEKRHEERREGRGAAREGRNK